MKFKSRIHSSKNVAAEVTSATELKAESHHSFRRQDDSAASQDSYGSTWNIFVYRKMYLFLSKIIDARAALNERIGSLITDERGDVPGWVLVVLMTTGLVTAIWAIAAPRISSLLRNSLDSMNSVR